MKLIYLGLLLFSATTWARGYQTGTFVCTPSQKGTITWTISAVDGLPVPYATCNAHVEDTMDADIRGIAAVEEISGGTLVGLRGLRGSEKFTILFNLDGTISAGAIPCTKSN